MIESLDTYLQPSALAPGDLVLQTAGALTPAGLVPHPVFFSGQVVRPDVVAAGLRTLVEVASTRYFNPIPGGLASLDPVMTANGDRLRCEAFSACNGVYARLDLLAHTFDNAALGLGTTNIDINPPLAVALAGVRREDPLHLSVGPSEVQMALPAGQFTERKVHLPERWVRGLAETQSLAATLPLRATLDALGWRRLLHALPMSGGSGAGATLWLAPAASSGLRQVSQPVEGAVSLAGTARLSAMKRLTHLVEGVRVYGPDAQRSSLPLVSGWEFTLPGARMTFLLSPQPWRGFSGEGAVLGALSQASRHDADTLAGLMAWEAMLDPAALADEAGISAARARDALQILATSGHVGFDLREQAYFHRQLPFVESRLEANYPRLAAARALVEAGAVTPDGDGWHVRVDDHSHRVRLGTDQDRCTCVFWAKYQGTRGPCKHVLAARLMRDA